MKITDVQTFLMHANVPDSAGWRARNWLFIKVHTDEGIYGVGEGSGWPRVVETAIRDLTPLLIGENPFAIEKLRQKLFIAMMGRGWASTSWKRPSPITRRTATSRRRNWTNTPISVLAHSEPLDFTRRGPTGNRRPPVILYNL